MGHTRVLEHAENITRIGAQGSCGYGLLDKAKYPFWSVAALSTANSYFLDGPLQGCGCATPGAVPAIASLPLYACWLTGQGWPARP